MATSIMTFVAAFGRNDIDFNVRLKGDDLDDQLAFIVLVKMRFDGEITGIGPHFIRGDGKKFGMITVSFPNYVSWDDARAHCNSHLDENGVVNTSYQGALDRADPGRRESTELKRQLLAAGSN
jgi:hypothetical protein